MVLSDIWKRCRSLLPVTQGHLAVKPTWSNSHRDALKTLEAYGVLRVDCVQMVAKTITITAQNYAKPDGRRSSP